MPCQSSRLLPCGAFQIHGLPGQPVLPSQALKHIVPESRLSALDTTSQGLPGPLHGALKSQRCPPGWPSSWNVSELTGLCQLPSSLPRVQKKQSPLGRLLSSLRALAPPGPGSHSCPGILAAALGGCSANSPGCHLPWNCWQKRGYSSSGSCSVSP